MQRHTQLPKASINNKTLPGVTIMGVGIVILIIGGALAVIYGFPTQKDAGTEGFISPAVLGVGGVVFVVGIGVTVWLKGRKPPRHRCGPVEVVPSPPVCNA